MTPSEPEVGKLRWFARWLTLRRRDAAFTSCFAASPEKSVNTSLPSEYLEE